MAPSYHHQNRRFFRQIDMIGRKLRISPPMRERLVARRFALLRVPLALVFVAGGMVGFLPILGLWMLPLGLVLLAVDLPFLRAPAGTLAVRLRALMRRWRR